MVAPNVVKKVIKRARSWSAHVQNACIFDATKTQMAATSGRGQTVRDED
jgi:hypothetical protein